MSIDQELLAYIDKICTKYGIVPRKLGCEEVFRVYFDVQILTETL